MFNIGGGELLVILVVALVFLGPERLPGAAKQVGKTISGFRDMAQSFQKELEGAVSEITDPIEEAARAAGDAAVAEDRKKKAAQAIEARAGGDQSDAGGVDQTADDEVDPDDQVPASRVTGAERNQVAADPTVVDESDDDDDALDPGPPSLRDVEPDRTEKPHSANNPADLVFRSAEPGVMPQRKTPPATVPANGSEASTTVPAAGAGGEAAEVTEDGDSR